MSWDLVITAATGLVSASVGALIVYGRIAVDWSKFREHIDEGPQLRKHWEDEKQRLERKIQEQNLNYSQLALTVEDMKEDIKKNVREIEKVKETANNTNIHLARIEERLDNNGVVLSRIFNMMEKRADK